MKSITLLFIFFLSCASISPVCKKSLLYEVIALEDAKNHEIIYLKKDNQTFKVISKKTKFNCEKTIKVGNRYYFDLKSIFEIHIKNNDSILIIRNHINIDCVQLDSEQFCKDDKKRIYDIYTTKNLQGLCYLGESAAL